VKRIAAALVLLLVFGAVKLPVEKSISDAHHAAYFHGARLDLSLREQIGQGAFLAALGGFRGVIADILSIQTVTAWQYTQWSRIHLLCNQITTLQPRVTFFWEMAANYMAQDAAAAALQDPKQPSQTLRVKASRDFIRSGRDFLERGIRNNPDRAVLYDRLGALLMDKAQDHYGAYLAFTKASEFPDSYGYQRRFAAYELSRCPGKEAQAYALLLKLYREGKPERTPTLLQRLKAMEEKLAIPPEQRVYNRGGTPP